MAGKRKKKRKKVKKKVKECARILSDLNSSSVPNKSVPSAMLLSHGDPGVFWGTPGKQWGDLYVGMRQGTEGHILVVGGSGTGKSSGIAKQTLRTWKEAIFALDVKVELSDSYKQLHRKGVVERPYIILDFADVEGPSYDPFWWLLQDDANNLFVNVKEIALSIIPNNPNEKERFWTDSEQALLEAALLYYFQLGLSFSETMSKIADDTADTLCKELAESTDTLVRRVLGELGVMETASSQTLYGIVRGFRNKLLPFATDMHICHVFRGKREGANVITWKDLEAYNIFFVFQNI